MTGWVVGGIIIGLAIVALAVGIPFFLTHRHMRSPRNVSDSRAYLRTRRRWLWWRRVRGAPYPETTSYPGSTGSRPAEPGRSAPALTDGPASPEHRQPFSSGTISE
jgi:hypothetical protein